MLHDRRWVFTGKMGVLSINEVNAQQLMLWDVYVRFAGLSTLQVVSSILLVGTYPPTSIPFCFAYATSEAIISR